MPEAPLARFHSRVSVEWDGQKRIWSAYIKARICVPAYHLGDYIEQF